MPSHTKKERAKKFKRLKKADPGSVVTKREFERSKRKKGKK